MTITRLFNFPVTIVSRTPSGAEDDWGNPIYDEVTADTMCYYEQTLTSDTDDGGGDTTWQDVRVFVAPTLTVDTYSAVRLDLGDGIVELEVVGSPHRALNARSGTVNHIVIHTRRAAA